MKEVDFVFLCERATYEHFNPNKNIFQYGDYGEKFYIVLQGSVQVLIPRRKDRASEDEIKDKSKTILQSNFMSVGESPDKKSIADKFRSATHKLIMNQRTTSQGLMEVAILKAGSAFGELALISNKARSATIKTLTETHLLVLNRKDFERVLRRQEEASISKLVDFFKSIPFFKNWTKNALSKLTYFFHRETFSRNQILKSKPQYQNLIGDKSINSYLGPQAQNRKDNHQRNQSFQLPNQGVQYEQQILIVGQGNFLGEEDAVKMVDYTTTVKCYSENGVLLVMKVQDFYQKIKGSTDTWQLIKNVAKSKENTTNNSLIRQYYLDKDNKEQAKEIVRQKINEVEIDDMEFFKTMFWGEPIPSRKIDKIIQLNSQMRESSKIVRVYKEDKQKLTYYNSFLQRSKVKLVGLGNTSLISKDKENDVNKQNKAVFVNQKEYQTQQAKQFDQYEIEPTFKNYYVSRNINNNSRQNVEIKQENIVNKDIAKPRQSNAKNQQTSHPQQASDSNKPSKYHKRLVTNEGNQL
ncbi:UNKNOWN [Stylonychia lemnae]|uniref:Cyclic nucleotide-binding domain-containing protein n=1 Tax=Stylonychia lemnae TaxID=5949 RepID=A0A078BAH0_STYLE|nr:UNKNOWN [Stylonychia lemnae]|eukprot:CDW90548.1 UNKNOWN [Stylonychia lemnae]